MARVAKSEREMCRLSLAVSADVRARMERLRDDTGADSITEVIRRAVAAYDFLWHEQTKFGAEIFSRLGEKEKQLVLFPEESVR